MKKLFHILFISVYLISSIGISIATHSCCCGTDSTLAVLYTERASQGENCYEDDCKRQACLTEVVSLKVKDLHISVPKDEEGHSAEMITIFSPEEVLKTTSFLPSPYNSGFYHSDPPVYLSNCNFRI